MASSAQQQQQKSKNTPGRAKRTGLQQQYFDVGKVGRITGITLADTGIRDEHGLEPIDNIFSSPSSPRRGGSGSDGFDAITAVSTRRTPRLPPPRASTPKHTNIGSPKRMSTGRPTSHRLSEAIEENGSPTRQRLERQPYGRGTSRSDTVYTSVEASPFKPKHNLRRSMGLRRTGVFDSPAPSGENEDTSETQHDSGIGNSQDGDQTALPEESHMMLPDDDSAPYLGVDDDEVAHEYADVDGEEEEPVEETQISTTSRPRRSLRQSGTSLDGSEVMRESERATAGRKRGRSSLNEDEGDDSNISLIQYSGSGQKRRRSSNNRPSMEQNIEPSEGENAFIDPALLRNTEETQDSVEEVQAEAEAAPIKGKGRVGRPKGKKPQPKPSTTTSVPLRDKSDASQGRSGGSVGPSSNVMLRATTPFDDAGQVTRSGRPVYGPLKFWANERLTYKRGHVDGIIRADEVEPAPRKAKKTAKKKKKGRRGNAAEDESETESVIADEWEADVGVLTGDVANWDPQTQSGDPNDLIHEDLAHAEISLEKREVHGGSNFCYSKILTMPFFGVGVMEIPPGGFKNTKNCKKFQLAFFVHKGKVMAEVNPPGDAPPNQFAITRGGVWIVPRGNDYSISNESRTTTAVIFFSQGSEIEISAAAAALVASSA